MTSFPTVPKTLHSVFVFMVLMNQAFANVHLEYISGSEFLLGTGARASSLAGAFTAVADDSSALFWNPAGHGNRAKV